MSDVKKFPIWKQAVEDFVSQDPPAAPGYILHDRWLLEHFEMSKPTSGLYEEIARFNLAFLDSKTKFFAALRDNHQIQFAERDGGGWRLLHPAEVARHSMSELAKATRAAALKAGRRISNVDVSELNDRQQAELADAAARLSRVRQIARKETRLPRPPQISDRSNDG